MRNSCLQPSPHPRQLKGGQHGRVYWHSLDSSLELWSKSTHLIATSIRSHRQVRMIQRSRRKLHASEKVLCNGSYHVSVLITGQLEECLPQQLQMAVEGTLWSSCTTPTNVPCQWWSCQRANECSRLPGQAREVAGEVQEARKVTVSKNANDLPSWYLTQQHWTWLLIGCRTTNKLIYLKLVPFWSTSIDGNQQQQKTIDPWASHKTHHHPKGPSLSGPIEWRGVLLIAFQIAQPVHMLIVHFVHCHIILVY